MTDPTMDVVHEDDEGSMLVCPTCGAIEHRYVGPYKAPSGSMVNPFLLVALVGCVVLVVCLGLFAVSLYGEVV